MCLCRCAYDTLDLLHTTEASLFLLRHDDDFIRINISQYFLGTLNEKICTDGFRAQKINPIGKPLFFLFEFCRPFMRTGQLNLKVLPGQ